MERVHYFRYMAIKSGCFVFLAFAFSFPGILRSEAPPPVEVFFRSPEFSDFRISPDGKTLAVLAPYEGYMNLAVIDLETRQPRIITGEKKSIDFFRWANSERLIYSMATGDTSSSSQYYAGGLFGINKDGTDLDVLVYPFRAEARGTRERNQELGYANLFQKDDEYIMVTNHQRRREYPDLFKLNVDTAQTSVYLRNPDRISGFFYNGAGEPVGGVEIDEQISLTYFSYDKDREESWKKIRYFEEDYQAINPLGYSEKDEERLLLVSSNHEADTQNLYFFNVDTAEFGEPVLQDETYDLKGSALSVPGEDRIGGVVVEKAKPEKHFFNAGLERFQEVLDATLPDTFNQLISVDEEGRIGVVESFSDRQAPKYYLVDMKEGKFEPLADSRRWLEGIELVEQQPVTFEARDGWPLHGYLYLPHHYEKGEKVPLVVNPHGGPWARDTWGIRWWLDLEPQYLASRGFAVLQVNFRGSTGYGKEHLKQSFKNLERMHNDVIDGVRWAIEEGIADPDRLGIMGASWGGYATMTALAKEPEMFQFGVNFFGVVDIPEHIRTYKEWDRVEGYNYWTRRIGDPGDEEDRAMLEEWSAIHHIEKIQAPVFIYHGKDDRNVDIEQSRMLVSELKKYDKPYEFVYRTDEMHAAFNEENRIDLYRQLDEFLKPFAPIKSQ